MSILLQLKNAAAALSGPLFRAAIISDMATIENEVNNIDIAVSGLTQNVTTSWVSGTAYAINDFRRSPINFQTYRRLTVGAGTVDPSADTVNWVAVAAGNNSQSFEVGPPSTSTQAVQLKQTSLIATVAPAAVPDIFVAAGATINLAGTAATITSFAACTAAQVGSTKTIIPAAAQAFTASTNLVIDGSVTGTTTFPPNAELLVRALTTTKFSITTIIARQTYTPTLNGFTVTGTYTVTGVATRIGNICTYSIKIVVNTGTVAAIAGTSYFGAMPYNNLDSQSSGILVDGTTFIGSGGNGFAPAGIPQVYAPAWAASANTKIVSGVILCL